VVAERHVYRVHVLRPRGRGRVPRALIARGRPSNLFAPSCPAAPRCVSSTRDGIFRVPTRHGRPHGPVSFAQLKYFARPASPRLRRDATLFQRLASDVQEKKSDRERERESERTDEQKGVCRHTPAFRDCCGRVWRAR